jgi:hypothetical protein
MPQRDADHDAVKAALINDGWTITHDPYTVTFEAERAFIDLGAERLLAADRADRAIAVEVKPFGGLSVIADVEQALGQYLLYRSWLARVDAERALWLAVSVETAINVFARPAVQALVDDYAVRVLVVDIPREEIVEWRS